MSIDDMIDEPMLTLVRRCIRRRDNLKELIGLNAHELVLKRARRLKSDAYAALRAQRGYDANQDPLESLAFEHLVFRAMKRGREKEMGTDDIHE